MKRPNNKKGASALCHCVRTSLGSFKNAARLMFYSDNTPVWIFRQNKSRFGCNERIKKTAWHGRPRGPHLSWKNWFGPLEWRGGFIVMKIIHCGRLYEKAPQLSWRILGSPDLRGTHNCHGEFLGPPQLSWRIPAWYHPVFSSFSFPSSFWKSACFQPGFQGEQAGNSATRLKQSHHPRCLSTK